MFLSMNGNSLRIYVPIVFGSVLASLFTLFALSVNVSAQDAPDYLFGNLTFERNLTKEQSQEISDIARNYTSTMLKAANGNETKLNVLLIEDLAKRNIIDEEAKQGFLSFIANIPKPPMEGLPGTSPGNLTIPGNVTLPGNSIDFLKDLDASSALLDEIAKNNSDSQAVTMMTDILKKRVTDIGTVVSGNGTNIVPFFEVTPGQFGKAVVCASLATIGNVNVGLGLACVDLLT
jgi:hypothetical protein